MVRTIAEYLCPLDVARESGTLSAAILDGEIVALDKDGRPSFQALQHRTVAPHAVAYYVFDILHLNGADLLRESLEKSSRPPRVHAERFPCASLD